MSFKAIYTDSKGNQKLLKIPWYAAFGPGPRKASSRPRRIQSRPISDWLQKTQAKICNACKGEGIVRCTCCHGEGKLFERGRGYTTGDQNAAAQRFSAHDTETYSKADNKKIVQMKKENKSWKEILEAINKLSRSQLQAHYKKNLQHLVEQSGDAGGNNGGGGYPNHAKEEYSKKNDKTIIQMKQAGKEWKEILAAIKKESLSQLKAHYKNDLQGGGSNSSQVRSADLSATPTEANRVSAGHCPR